ncbi:unnamed protein product [Protopolystoma xenopodis]|uniref:Protein SAAL1 n=1 Tax=Protopolystoma xenopodis TaxID=117903 RepID=A0A448X4J6_9PLAT|nr:unnamed protein product [Protopolystoma xenopodis]
MYARNPSPPPDLPDELKYADNIGDTSYSRQWLLSLMVKIVDKIKENNKPLSDDLIEDLDSDFEEQLCLLWDMTVSKDILKCLTDFDLIAVLYGATSCFCHPRLIEISLGILANLANEPHACHKMAEIEDFVPHIFTLFRSHDARILTEACRSLLQTVIISEEYNKPWLDAIRFESDFFENLMFILRSSTNTGLLMNTIRLIEAVCRDEDSLAEAWCSPRLISCILEAQKQIQWMHGSEVEIIHRLLYIFSTNQNGVISLVNKSSLVIPMLAIYLRKLCEDEASCISFGRHHNSLRAIIPVIDVIVASISPSKALAETSSRMRFTGFSYY